ncbi:G2/mitotic-specific cyclin [Geranomyces variabilis]|uniref:G2/mitotic-specific cyclin n=1 Tax=Geranomyces variabilis TaxID=109894 RepID=A0AAD5TM58_9FUNG|nr:G2/mitotic-specific cyclin [Geranomyces variabilis]
MEQIENKRTTRAASVAGQKALGIKQVDNKLPARGALGLAPSKNILRTDKSVALDAKGNKAVLEAKKKPVVTKAKKEIRALPTAKSNLENADPLKNVQKERPVLKRESTAQENKPGVSRVPKRPAVKTETSTLRDVNAGNAAPVRLQPETVPNKTLKTEDEVDVDVDADKENRAAPANAVVPKHVRDDSEDLRALKKVKVNLQEPAQKNEWNDLDAEDEFDPMMVSEYVDDIFKYLLELEIATMPNPHYIDIQDGLAWSMREILIDWIIDLSNHFRLLPETLYTCVNIIDRFLTDRPCSMNKLQLVGLAALFIAAKYEEVNAPSISSIVYFGDGGYVAEDIMKAERYILQILKFELHYPTPLSFLRRCSKAEGYDIQTRTVAKYLMEISIVDHRFLAVRPSVTAAAALYLARKMLQRGPWDANLVHYSGYKEVELAPTVELMTDYLKRQNKTNALYKKYSSRKFLKASYNVHLWIAHTYQQAAAV